MDTATKSPILIYTEQTPNPESLKYVTNRMLFKGTADFESVEEAKEWSPLAVELFSLPYVRRVYICNNFITISKELNYQWEDIMLKLKDEVKKLIDQSVTAINEGYEEYIKSKESEQSQIEYSGDDESLVQRIKELIDTYVRPAVEMDGGNIVFKSFENGVVSVILQGSCSGCPSSTVTLKAGIEGMLKRMVPQVTEVVQEMG
jgi:NFU1 iron-sulfur cluster scaffold homolog, mitochondrial